MATALKLVDKLISEIDHFMVKGKRFISYRVEKLERKYVQQATAIIKDAFTNRTEPLGQNQPKEFWDVFTKLGMGEGRIHPTSSVAILDDNTDSDKVIGVCVCRDLAKSEEGLPPVIDEEIQAIECPDNYNNCWPQTIVNEVTKDFKQQRKDEGEFKNGVILECHLTAVHKDYARMGVVTKLKKNMINVARKKGYKYVVSEATNKYSQAQNMKIGFKIEKEIFYKEWKYEGDGKGSGEYPFAWTVDKYGHDKLAFMVYYL